MGFKFEFAKYVTFRNVLILGLLISFGVSLSEFLRGEHANYMIFANATRDFWNGITPYGAEWWRHKLDFFLYAPPFTVFFAPFAFLPDWIGVFAWNLSNCLLFALSIYTLPRISEKTKTYILLYTLPILGTGQLDFQYNIAVAYIFMFVYTLFESGKGKWAMLLIMVSAMTKVYGGFELLLVLLYPKFWKNVAWGSLWAIAIFCLPLVKIAPLDLVDYYVSWFNRLMEHSNDRAFESFFDIKFIWSGVPTQIQPYIQLGVCLAIVGLTFWRLKWREYFDYRVGVLAVITGYIVLFGSGTEKHTYIISLVAFAYWYYLKPNKTTFDRVLFWSIFVIMELVTVDLIFPKPIMLFVFDTLDLNKVLFTLAWSYMVYSTYFVRGKRGENLISN